MAAAESALKQMKSLGWGALVALSFVGAASAQPTFSKLFIPDTIGPGSVSTLEFTIDNTAGAATTDLAFSDTLPAGVSIATPANASTTCDEGVVTAMDGGGTISLSGGDVGAGQTCTVTVDVTSSTAGVHTNTSGDLTSSAGNSGTATDDLTVDTARPGFSKSFSPATVFFGGRSTLTFTIDNSLNPSLASNLSFTDNLPSGIVVAGPANISNTCFASLFTGGVVTAVPGSSVISLSSGGGLDLAAVAASSTCTVSVDVIGGAIGANFNVTGELTSVIGITLASSGKASDTLTVTAGGIVLSKTFTDDPVPPGGTVTLEFTILNRDRNFSATNIDFTDALPAGLSLVGSPSPDPPCGAGSSLSGTTTLSFMDGDLPPQGSCTFSVTLSVPAMATPGSFTNTTSSITGEVDGTMVTGDPASEIVVISPVPLLTKTFTGDPVAAGGMVTIDFTITNTGSTSASDIAFIDELTTFLPFPVSVTLPVAPCGGTMTLVSLDTDRQGLSLTGGSLAAAGMPGDSCTFMVTLDIPSGLAPGIYVNTTMEPTATVGGMTVTGKPASDSFEVVAAPSLTKEFTDDPVNAGGTVTLEFTLTNTDVSNAASAIAFTDALGAALSGLTIGSVLFDDCSGTPSGVGTDTFGYSGGSLAAGSSCTIRLSLTVPGGATVGSFTNTTSTVSATVAGVAVTSAAASDDLFVGGLEFTKEFTDDPVVPGGTATLRFTIENTTPGTTFGGIFFTDSLSTVLPGLTATSLPSLPAACGGSASLSGTSLLIFTGGEVAPSSTCTFDVTVTVPGGTPNDTFANITSSLTVTSPSTIILPPATDTLTVDSTLLELSKEFTDDPAVPGGTVTLEFTVTNLDPSTGISSIAFTDDLSAALAGLTATSTGTNTCSFTVGGLGTGMLSLSGGSVGAGGSCTLSLTLTLPAMVSGGPFVNTTSSLTGDLGGLTVTGDPASDTLAVRTLTFTKSFGGSLIAGSTQTLTFTITNLDTSSGIGELSFTDDLAAVVSGLAVSGALPSDPCGIGSSLTGSSLLTLTGGNLAASGMCSFIVTVTVPAGTAAGSFTNTSSDLRQFGLPVAGPASAPLSVVTEADLVIAKSDSVDPVIAGGSLTYTVTVTNNGPSDAQDVVVTDTLPAGVTLVSTSGCAEDPAGAPTCTLGTIAAGGMAQYTIMVAVSSSATGVLTNSASVSSSTPEGNSGDESTSEMTAVSTVADLVIAKSDSADPVPPGSTLTYTITVTNNGPSDAAGVVVTDTLPAGVTLVSTSGCAEDPSAAPTCTLGTIAASGSAMYTITVTVDSSTLGLITNNATVTSSTAEGNPGDESTSETTNVALLDFSKEFIDDPVVPGGTVTLEFTISALTGGVSASGLTFTDDLGAVVPGLAAVGLPASDVCGSGSMISGTSLLTFTAGSLPAGGSCTFSVTLEVPLNATPGVFTNTTSDLEGTIMGASSGISSRLAAPPTGLPAQDDLAIIPPPGPALQVPTLNEWGLILLMAGLLLVGARWLGLRF